MPLPSWLRARFAKPGPTNAAELAADLAADPIAAAPPPASAPEREPHQPDNMVRMHIAASDPNFPAKRDAAITQIIAAIDTTAAAHGFTKKPRSWAKSGPLGTVSIQLQRSRFGFDCDINLGWSPLSETPLGPWLHDDVVPLAQFLPVPDTAILIYLDVADSPAHLDAPMHALNTRALPWLIAHLTDPNAALIATD
ncbi:hypothetical protein SAMN05216227_100823 [Pseudorhodobacter antarcticus]|uniref:Uncharacterized protein n=1 Tax=Pseudorhodobacter antarcticus TaxID=1077947 RepID=A0A1H8E1J5_9RHOB|nr:DUF4304 domain-containing protein [Pseudorhodobacter antarcticus]SEN13313.1 hypothetical protein SAMN05216227_100823 [Pseudorhodobacter antarcticus]